MIDIKLKESNRTVKLSELTTSPIVIEEQLDTSLDSGTLNYLRNELTSSELNEALASYSINVDNATFDFVGMDSRAVIRKNFVQHTIEDTTSEITEPATHIRGVFGASGKISINGFGVKNLKIKGSGRSIASGTYSNGEVAWNAIIFSNNKPDSYTVTIVYDSNDDNIYSHQVALTEPSKLLQGVMIDGFGVTQPEAYDSRKNLYEVVKRLLAVTPFDGQRFTLTNDKKVYSVLQSVVSPEFKWNTQTSLWECLLQVGAVIDAIPRLIRDDDDNFTVITFDFVNANVGEVDSLADEATNAFGENVDESLYNTALSSVVENLRENE